MSAGNSVLYGCDACVSVCVCVSLYHPPTQYQGLCTVPKGETVPFLLSSQI